ncbi:hypothetical protein LTR56_010546 [Elasticomyces elasticus]|nr:hypothetical protein LTR56_010546 [Elasticomyces elasticus]KAK3657962.1 hypothetical protein LTR22_009189 [Elasticomyces elasticus]KAK5762869.1 hypothetical protein LTS12_007058 [Elasticomyces elasticus]
MPSVPDEKSEYQHRHQHRAQLATQDRAPLVFDDPAGVRRVRQALEGAAARNSELLATLGATEEAVGALQQVERHLIILQDEITQQSQIAKNLSSATHTYFAAHRRYRNGLGKIRRLYYAFTGMHAVFEEKAAKAETLYFDSLRKQAELEDREKALKHDLVEVKAENERLSRTVKEHGATHEAIDELYASIFDGRTPGFPNEDELEWEHRRAATAHEKAAKSLKAAVTERKSVTQLKRLIDLAGDQVSAAREEVEHSFLNLAGAAVWFIRCAKYLERATKLYNEPMYASDAIESQDFHEARNIIKQNLTAALEAANAVRNPALVDSDTGREAADTITARLNIVSHAIDEMSSPTKQAETAAERVVKDTARTLEDSRQALQEIRQGAFEITVGFGAAAPAYNECCDRAAGFENDAIAQCQRVVVEDVENIDGMPPPPSYERA